MLGLLRSPTAYQREPGKYAANQIGHAYIVGFIPAYFLGALFIPVIALVYAFWEYIQLRKYGATLSDGIEDLGHVLMGAFAALFPWVIIPHLVLIAAGVQWRRENAK